MISREIFHYFEAADRISHDTFCLVESLTRYLTKYCFILKRLTRYLVKQFIFVSVAIFLCPGASNDTTYEKFLCHDFLNLDLFGLFNDISVPYR